MTKLLSARDFIRIQEAASILGVSEQTLRNWDRAGKLRAHRHPINGYRLYRAADLHAFLQTIGSWANPDGPGSSSQLALELFGAVDGGGSEPKGTEALPPCHWNAEVALDPKHRPQRWDGPSTTVRRDWRKYPQEAYVLDSEGRRYRRLTVEEIAILQGFSPTVADVEGLTNRQRIASIGDAVPPPLAKAVVAGMDAVWDWSNRTALEICAGLGGLAEGAVHVGLEHEALIDISPVCGQLLRHGRSWSSDAVHVGDARSFDYDAYRGRIGLLSGGPPCQPWSQSGHRRGREDERDLLGHLDAVVRALEPEVFVFENVMGLATPANEPYLRHVIETLRRPGGDLRYGVLVGILNAADFGVPQLRRRVFILGFRDCPASFAGRCFAEIEGRATHVDPALPRRGKMPWLTVGEAIASRPDPGGWRRWIGVAA
jgi:excisionase family DNA binding protein